MSTNRKVIYQTKTIEDVSAVIQQTINLLRYMQDGYDVEFYTCNETWVQKGKDSPFFDTKHVEYRVLEKKKEVTVYTIVYQTSSFGIGSWSTIVLSEYDRQLRFLDGKSLKLLKTYTDTVQI